MPTLQEVRQQYPQYNDMNDQQLSDALYKKFYSDMPRADFDKKLGVTQTQASPGFLSEMTSAVTDIPNQIGKAAGEAWNTILAAGPNSPENTARMERIKKNPMDISTGLEGLGNVGRAVMAVPQLAASPITGASRSLIGHPYDALSPTFTPEQKAELAKSGITLPTGAEVADTAMMAARPAGVGPNGPIMKPVGGPTVSQVETAANADYGHPSVTSLEIKPSATAALRQKIDADLLNNKVDKYVAPTVDGIISRLEKPRFGTNSVVADLDLARQSLSDVPFQETRAASIARKAIDDYMAKIPQSDLISGDAAAANKFLTQGRANWAAAQRAKDIERALNNSEIQAGSTYAGGNLNNATRQQLKPLLRQKKNAPTLPGWTPEEVAQLRNAVMGTTTGNVSRAIGKAGPNGGLMGAGHVAAAISSGGTTLPISAATVVARKVGEISTQRQIDKLLEMLLSRSPLGQAMATQSVPVPAPYPALSGIPLSQIPNFSLPPLMGLVPSRADQKK